MNNKLVKFKLHGDLGDKIGKEWDLQVNTVAQGLHAIELSTKKFINYIKEKNKEGGGYRVLINGDDILLDQKKITKESILNSEFFIKKNNLKTVDIIPVLEGSAPFLVAFVVVLVIGAIAAVVTYMLAKPPKYDDFREIESGGKVSYLFNGPYNTTREGGPVPIGYGELLVGSQVISSSYVITDYQTF